MASLAWNHALISSRHISWLNNNTVPNTTKAKRENDINVLSFNKNADIDLEWTFISSMSGILNYILSEDYGMHDIFLEIVEGWRVALLCWSTLFFSTSPNRVYLYLFLSAFIIRIKEVYRLSDVHFSIRPFGINTTWYLRSDFEWLKLLYDMFTSSFGSKRSKRNKDKWLTVNIIVK